MNTAHCLRVILTVALLAPATFAEEKRAASGTQLPLVTREALQGYIGFFVMKYKDKATPVPKAPMAAKDITTLGGLTGIHRVYPEGHDSLHAFQCLVKSGDRTFRYCFDFTLSPSARWDSYSTAEELFSGRSLTQYYICRIATENNTSGIDDILIQSNTDPLMEKKAESGPNAAEKLFRSPKAKAP